MTDAMDITDISGDIGDLEESISALEAALQPLMDDLSGMSSKLPVLDKAKLQTLVSYAIESLLFSSVRLDGSNTQRESIQTELKRIKQYFDKIQKIESPPEERQATLNTEGAARVIRAGLDNDDKERLHKLNELIKREREKAAANSSQSSGKTNPNRQRRRPKRS